MKGWLVSFLLKRGVSAGILGWIGPALYAIAVVAIFSAGVWVRGTVCDVARYKLENEQLKAQITFLEESNRKKDEAAKKDAEKAEEDAIAIADLEAQLGELTDGLPNKDLVCLDAAAVERLRKFWGQKD